MTPSQTRPLPVSPGILPGEKSAGSKASFHIPSLDGIRAVSFGIVFLSHAAGAKWIPGYFGLATFFFLSGYLITTLLRMEFDRTDKISFRDFYLRRVLRIFPPLYLILGLDCVLTLTHVLGNTLWPQAVLAQAFHLTNYWIVAHSHNPDAGWWYGMAPGSWIFWSLAVEEHFYLVFPLLYLLMRRRELTPMQQMRVLVGLCAAVLLWRCVLVFGFHVTKERTYVASDTRIDSILFGCLLAVYANPFLDTPTCSAERIKNFWVPLAVTTLLVSFGLGRLWPDFDQTLRYTVQGAALIPIFIAAVRYPWWGIFRWLNLPAMQFLGLLSYSLYLMHTTALYAVEHWTHWGRPLVCIAALAVCLVLATLIYHFVEKPCARLRKRLSHVRRPAGLPADPLRPASPPDRAIPPDLPVAASQPPQAAARLEFIDGLRGLAMMMVLLFHCWTFGGQWHVNIPVAHHTINVLALFGTGHIGVGLFLVLSGFCLYWPFAKAGTRREPTLWEFAKKRCRRILPPYYIALLLFGSFALFQALFDASDSAPLSVLKSLGLHLLMLHNMRPETFFDLNGSFWSLALEFHLYILFPIFVEALRRFPARNVLFIVLAFTSGFRFLVVHIAQSTDDPWVNVLTYSVFGRCLEFLLGMIAAQFLARRTAGEKAFLKPVDGALIAGIIVLMLLGRHQGLVEVFKAALSGFAFVALLLAASSPGSLLNRCFSSRPMVTLGVFSYSVYLIHQPLAVAFGNLTVAWGLSNGENIAFQLLVVVPGLLALGYLFHLAFERPFLSAHARRETQMELSGAPEAMLGRIQEKES